MVQLYKQLEILILAFETRCVVMIQVKRAIIPMHQVKKKNVYKLFSVDVLRVADHEPDLAPEAYSV